MTSLVEAIYQVKYNPFKYAEYLASFYSTLSGVKENLLLAPLIIPLCSHHVFSTKLSNANSKSTIWTIFSNRVLFHDLQVRIDDFKKLTEQSIQYCLVNDWVEIKPEDLAITCAVSLQAPFEKQKSAVNLGKLFSNLSAVEIYAFLGVKP